MRAGGFATSNFPKRCKELLDKGIFSEDDLFKINKELPEKVYGVELDF